LCSKEPPTWQRRTAREQWISRISWHSRYGQLKSERGMPKSEYDNWRPKLLIFVMLKSEYDNWRSRLLIFVTALFVRKIGCSTFKGKSSRRFFSKDQLDYVVFEDVASEHLLACPH